MARRKLTHQTKIRLKHAEEDGAKAVAEIEKILTGHTDQPKELAEATVTGLKLKSFIERIERLEAEKAALAEDIKEVYAEAKGQGFDAKTMRRVVRLRKMDEQKRREAQELLDLYAAAIGMQYALL